MTDPYGTLNVPSDASREEIRSAFIRIARTTHPDKAGNNTGAADAFTSVDEAWKILGDDQMKDAYDEYGFTGTEALQILRTQKQGSTLISKKMLKNRVNMNEHMLMDSKSHTRSVIRCHLQMLDVINFLYGNWESSPPQFPFPGLDHVLLETSTQFPLGEKDLITLSAVAGSARRWKSNRRQKFVQSQQQIPTLGSLTITYIMLRGLNMFEYSFTGSSLTNSPPKMSLKCSRTISKTLNASSSFNADMNDTGLAFVLAKQLTAFTSGTIQVGFGNEDGVSVGLRHEGLPTTTGENEQQPRNSKRQIQGNFQVRATDGFVLQSSWSEPISKQSKLKTSFHFSLSNIVFEMESMKAFSEISKFSGGVSVGLRSGVTFKLRFLRGSTRYEFPILISPQVSIGTTLAAGIFPLLIQYVVKRVMFPFQKAARLKQRQILRDACKQARLRATNQMNLMKSSSDVKKENQKKVDGLVILLGRYGNELQEENSWTDPELRPNIDVTTQLNYFVKDDSTLDLAAGSKSNLLGFYDPSLSSISRNEVWAKEDDDDDDENKEKKNELFIRYSFRGLTYEAVFPDFEPIHLPSSKAVRVI